MRESHRVWGGVRESKSNNVECVREATSESQRENDLSAEKPKSRGRGREKHQVREIKK